MAPVDTEYLDQSFEPRVVRPHLSYSQISMYLRCSMQYKFRYILGLKQPPVLRIAIGKGGHAALEYEGRHFLRTQQHLRPIDISDKASDFIDIESSEVEDATPKDKGEAKDRALASLRVYAVRDLANVNPSGVEVEFNLDINDDPNIEPIDVINGKIDLITVEAGVDDYKFVNQMRSQGEVDISPQLSLYGKVFHQLTGRWPSNLGYRMFLPGSTRTPPDSRALRRDPALMTPEAQARRYERLKYQFREAARGIRDQRFIPVDDPKVCSWCGYRERCQGTSLDDFTAARIRGEV